MDTPLPHLNPTDPRSILAHIDIIGMSLARCAQQIPELREYPPFAAAGIMLAQLHSDMANANDIKLDIRDSISLFETGKTSAEFIIDNL